jgi:hypothetical protein
MKKASLVIILTAILSLGIVVAHIPAVQAEGTYISDRPTPQSVTITPPVNDPSTTRLNLNRLLLEHGMLVTLHLQAIYDGKDTNPTKQLLNDNTNKLAALFTAATNTDSGQFVTLWAQHIQQYERYTQALKNNDGKTMADSRAQLEVLSNKVGQLFDLHNRNITADMITQHMRDHTTGTLGIIDAYAQHNQEETVTRIKQSTEQAKTFADLLAENITGMNR